MLIAAGAADAVGRAAGVAGRELGWNMGSTAGVILMYALAVFSLVIFGMGLRQRILFWKRGKPAGEGFGDWSRRLWILVRETFLQVQTRRRFLPGLFHSMIFYSFLMLFITTLIVMAQMDFGLRIFHGSFYLVISLLADLAGAFLLIGVVIAAVRRYLQKPDFLPQTKPVDTLVLAILAFLVLTGFLAEGARIRFHPGGDPWKAWTPVGSLCASMLGRISPRTGEGLHFVTWWLHALGTFTMIALIPYTKLFHLLAIPTNQFLSKLAPKGSLQRVDIEALFASDDVDEDFAIGVSTGQHMTWKQRLDLSACIQCGRCDDVCPVRIVDQPLSPRGLIEDLKTMLEQAQAGRAAVANQCDQPAVGGSSGQGSSGGDAAPAAGPIIGAAGTVFADKNFVWHCRTCHACQSICPAGVAHVDLLIELRRAEVMMAGRLPSEAGRALKTMEAEGNPFGGQAERMDLVAKLGIPILGEGDETDVLFWIGCTTTFDPEKHAIAEDMIAIMRQAGVSCAHLGREETCCGDPARILGDENLFQTTAKRTIETLKKRRFKHLLVTCPHGFNVFKNEYPQFDGAFPVVHHAQLLAGWIREGRLRLKKPVPGTVVFHDPCYLGRYQSVFAPPREVLRAIPGLSLREMKANRKDSFCCGAGGGHYWMDLDTGDQRTYTRRVDEAIEAGAETIAVACAFCYQMLTDGLKARDLDERLKIRDLANLVRRSLDM